MAGEQLAGTVLMGVALVVVVTDLFRAGTLRSLDIQGAFGGGTTVSNAKPSGVLRWLTTVDHKDIGIMYGVYAIAMFVWAGVAATIMRIELSTPAMDALAGLGGSALYNGLLTSHGIAMLILFGTPILTAFSNYLIPLLIGADNMAFPRINVPIETGE